MTGQARIVDDHQIEIVFKEKISPQSKDFLLTLKKDPDIPLAIHEVKILPEKPDTFLLTTELSLDTKGEYQLLHTTTGSQWGMAPSLMMGFLSIVLMAALVQNFVFTRYLGLCVFFGVSRKRETAVGMGITFTIVGLLSGLLSWIVDRYLLHPLSLHFLQIIVFIGIIAFLVQMTDTILRKVNRPLHRKFGIYVVLITTNCIILAVPLLNALNASGFFASLALALGSGLGFALALFLMSCAREKADLSPVPKIFAGLPIAFILAGLFAITFMGFSGFKL